jgi:hypothetical protein
MSWRFMSRPAAAPILRPTAVLPVKPIMSTSGEATSAAPVSTPDPVTTFTTPAGTPASWTISANRSTCNGSCGAGLQEEHREGRAHRRLHQQQHHGDQPDAVSGGRRPGPADRHRHHHELPAQPGLPLPGHVPEAELGAGLARDPAGADRRDLQLGVQAGTICIGGPDEVERAVQSYVNIGADQLVFGMLSTTMPIEVAVEAVDTFGRHVLPKFDKDPVHSTTRQREAQLAPKA